MPPSGYSIDQVDGLRSFLDSCSRALEAEGLGFGESPIEALEREIRSISDALPAMSTMFVGPVLMLTRDFYSALLQEQPQTYAAFREVVERQLEKLRTAVLGVHIAPSRRPVSTLR